METYLPTLKERLNSTTVSTIETLQRKTFITVMKSLELPKYSQALSVSCGTGFWDYLLFKENKNIKKITATDIVKCPINAENINFLNRIGTWNYVRVEPEKKLPFRNSEFNLIFHNDVIEHVNKPFMFLSEQYRVLKKGGFLVFSTPNLFRPANLLKLLIGRLTFPLVIGHTKEIGDYIHIQEFNERQLDIMLQEIGFSRIKATHSFFGLSFMNINLSSNPKTKMGKTMCQYLFFTAQKK